MSGKSSTGAATSNAYDPGFAERLLLKISEKNVHPTNSVCLKSKNGNEMLKNGSYGGIVGWRISNFYEDSGFDVSVGPRLPKVAKIVRQF